MLTAALVIQLLGILIGVYTLAEIILKKSSVSILIILNKGLPTIFRDKREGKDTDTKEVVSKLFAIINKVNLVYEEISKPIYFLIFLSVVIWSLLFSIGYWISCGYFVYEVVFQTDSISRAIRIIFIVYSEIFVMFYIVISLSFKKKEEGLSKRRKIVAVIKNIFFHLPKKFFKNIILWNKIYIKLSFHLVIVIVLLMPAWVLSPFLKFNLGFRTSRRNYYLVYTAATLAISTVMQIIASSMIR